MMRSPRRWPLCLLCAAALWLGPMRGLAREPAAAENPEAKAGAVRVYRFDNLDIEGHVKNPHLMYFLKRVKNSFRTFRLPEQKFTRDVIRTRDADFL